jgi:tight adherence protein C
MLNNNTIAIILGVCFAAIVFLGMQFNVITDGFSTLGSTLATILGLAIFFMVYFSVESFVSGIDMTRRYNKIEATQSAKAQSIAAQTRLRKKFDEAYKKDHPFLNLISGLGQRLFRIQGSKVLDLRMRLLAAGFLNEKAVTTFLAFRAIVPVALMISALFWAVFASGESASTSFGYMLGAGIAGWFGVEYFVTNRTKTRREKIQRELPDIIDLLTIYTESGVSFDVGLGKVIEVLKKRAPTACSEMLLFERELQLLPDRQKAYDNLVKRADCSMVKSFVSILTQADKIGSPISASLRQLGLEARREILRVIEKKAAKIPILINLPVMFFFLPALLLIVIGPTIVTASKQFNF